MSEHDETSAGEPPRQTFPIARGPNDEIEGDAMIVASHARPEETPAPASTDAPTPAVVHLLPPDETA